MKTYIALAVCLLSVWGASYIVHLPVEEWMVFPIWLTTLLCELYIWASCFLIIMSDYDY